MLVSSEEGQSSASQHERHSRGDTVRASGTSGHRAGVGGWGCGVCLQGKAFLFLAVSPAWNVLCYHAALGAGGGGRDVQLVIPPLPLLSFLRLTLLPRREIPNLK